MKIGIGIPDQARDVRPALLPRWSSAGPELDNPVLYSLTGRQQTFALHDGRAVRLPRAVGPFMAVPDDAGDDDWRALARLAGPGGGTILRSAAALPAGWTAAREGDEAQMTGTARRPVALSAEVSRLDRNDLAQMHELAGLTTPGPFASRTPELGVYLGIKQAGRLVAMAGERLRTERWVELSTVCTHPDWRGRGYAATLVAALSSYVRGGGRQPFLHVPVAATAATALFEKLGFVTRRHVSVTRAVPPAG